MVKTRTEAEAALTIARRELNRAVYGSETYQNPGLAKIAADKTAWLITLISMAESCSNFYWVSCDLIMPENIPENAGKKVIPCIVSIKSKYPNGKPNIQKRMRQFRRYPEPHWEWSQSNKDRITHWAAIPNPPEA